MERLGKPGPGDTMPPTRQWKLRHDGVADAGGEAWRQDWRGRWRGVAPCQPDRGGLDHRAAYTEAEANSNLHGIVTGVHVQVISKTIRDIA